MRRVTSGRGRSGGGDRSAAPPDAVRQARARVLDARLLGGVALLVASALAGAVLLTRHEETVTVWRAARDLSAGAVPHDVEAISIPRAVGADLYVEAPTMIDAPLRWPVAQGELVPVAALATSAAPMRQVTVPVDPLHAPVGLLPGDVVDVWASSSDAVGAMPTPPRLVLPAAVVVAVSDEGLGLGGELAVVLEVPSDDVPAAVAATRSGAVDLTAVPVSAQGPAA